MKIPEIEIDYKITEIKTKRRDAVDRVLGASFVYFCLLVLFAVNGSAWLFVAINIVWVVVRKLFLRWFF